MHLVASVCPYVCLSVFFALSQLNRVCLCVCNQGAHTGNSTDAVDRLLIMIYSCMSNGKGLR